MVVFLMQINNYLKIKRLLLIDNGNRKAFSAYTGCSLNIVCFLQRWCLTCHCVHSLTPRGNRERPESGIYFQIFVKTRYLMISLYKSSEPGRSWGGHVCFKELDVK